MKRSAARVLLFDEQDRLLLFRGIDSIRPEAASWWFTPGGGLESGEIYREAAMREVFEETGVRLKSVVGPVYEQEIDLIFEGEAIHQVEQFFVARVREIRLNRDGWTDLEKRTMLESRWWSVEDLVTTTETIYPQGLADLVRLQLRR